MGASVGSGGRRGRRQLAEINVTPLVDVMLVLLIISMVAAPMMERGVTLELPEMEATQEINDAMVIVSIDREARIRINDKPVHPELLLERMKALALSRPDEVVFLRGDKLLPYQEVLRVMDTILKAGITNISVVTLEKEEEV